MRTQVKCVSKIRYHEQINVGDIGYIDGHVRGGDDTPYIVCIFGIHIVYASFYNLEVLPTPLSNEDKAD